MTTPAPAVDRDAVKAGDTVTYLDSTGYCELTAEVEYATADACHIKVRSLRYPIAWHRILSHTCGCCTAVPAAHHPRTPCHTCGHYAAHTSYPTPA